MGIKPEDIVRAAELLGFRDKLSSIVYNESNRTVKGLISIGRYDADGDGSDTAKVVIPLHWAKKFAGDLLETVEADLITIGVDIVPKVKPAEIPAPQKPLEEFRRGPHPDAIEEPPARPLREEEIPF